MPAIVVVAGLSLTTYGSHSGFCAVERTIGVNVNDSVNVPGWLLRTPTRRRTVR